MRNGKNGKALNFFSYLKEHVTTNWEEIMCEGEIDKKTESGN